MPQTVQVTQKRNLVGVPMDDPDDVEKLEYLKRKEGVKGSATLIKILIRRAYEEIRKSEDKES